MRKYLDKDVDLNRAYLSNIAMLLHDRYGIVDYTIRNEAADEILKLVFDCKTGLREN